jgi:hypothetical protein
MAKHCMARGPGFLDDRLRVRAWQLLPLFEAADPRLGLPCDPTCSECHLWHLPSIVPQLAHSEALAGLSSDEQARVYYTTVCLSHHRLFRRWWLEHTTVPNEDAIRYRAAVTGTEREAIVARRVLEGSERLRRQKGKDLTWQEFRAAWREGVERQPGLPAVNVAIRKASVILGVDQEMGTCFRLEKVEPEIGSTLPAPGKRPDNLPTPRNNERERRTWVVFAAGRTIQ